MMAGFEEAYRQDLDERTRVLGAENIDPSMAFGDTRDERIADGELKTHYDADGLVIRAFQVDHPDWLYAYGYRIEYRGKSIVISGDTRPSDNLVAHAKGAGFLVHEALNLEAMTYIGEVMDRTNGPIPGSRMSQIAHAHTTTEQLARIAEHFFTAGMGEIDGGEIRVARDGRVGGSNPPGVPVFPRVYRRRAICVGGFMQPKYSHGADGYRGGT